MTGAWIGRRPLDRHPNTDVELVGGVVPSGLQIQNVTGHGLLASLEETA